MSNEYLAGPAPLDPASQAAADTRQRSLAQLRALGYSQVPRADSPMRGRATSAVQAALSHGSLGELWQQALQAQECLSLLGSVLPAALVAHVQCGPIQGGQWTLFVANSAAAAKIRQSLPTLVSHLRGKGWMLEEILVKIRPR